MGSSEWLFGFVCGGLGGAAGQIVTNPIDIVKIKLQLQKGSRGSGLRQGGGSVVGGWRMLTDHVKATGAKGLFRGVSVAAGHQFVYSGVRLQAYEVLKEQVSDDAGFSTRVLLAATSGVAATIVSNPLERCKVVIQAFPKDKCPSFGALLRAFTRYSSENAVAAFKREPRSRPQGLMGGVGASVQRSAIVHAVQLSVYDSLRDFSATMLSASPVASMLFAAVFSGLVSAGVGAPFDVVKTRLMAQQGRSEYSGIVDCAVRTVKDEGVSALFKGYLATWLKIGPFTVAQFWIWEQSMRYVSDRQDLPQAYSADES